MTGGIQACLTPPMGLESDLTGDAVTRPECVGRRDTHANDLGEVVWGPLLAWVGVDPF